MFGRLLRNEGRALCGWPDRETACIALRRKLENPLSLLTYGQNGSVCRVCLPAKMRFCDVNTDCPFLLPDSVCLTFSQFFQLSDVPYYQFSERCHGITASCPVLPYAPRRYELLHQRIQLPLAHMEKLRNLFLAFAHPFPVQSVCLKVV